MRESRQGETTENVIWHLGSTKDEKGQNDSSITNTFLTPGASCHTKVTDIEAPSRCHIYKNLALLTFKEGRRVVKLSVVFIDLILP